MIKLKSLLNEIISEQQSKTKAPRVLFIGDSQTAAPWSYANRLLNSGTVTGKIVAKNGANTDWMLRQARSNISNNYDIVSVLGGGNDAHSKSADNAIQNLSQIYKLAKSNGLKVVAISNPTKQYSEKANKYPSNDKIADWVNTQSISDITIDANSFSRPMFGNDFIHMNEEANKKIANLWMNNISTQSATKDDEASTELEVSPELNVLQIGDRGASVLSMQQNLMRLGYFIGTMEDDGIFGPYTQAGLKKFQSDFNLKNDGIFDASTKAKLDAEAAKAPAFNSNEAPGRAINLPAGATGSANEVIKFFIAKGLTAEQGAGIAGNLYTESAFKTGAVGDSGTSKGVAQWHNERWDNLVNWCEDKGFDPYSFKGQLEFLWHELNTTESKALSKISATSTPSDAAHAFAKYFERPKIIQRKRKDAAETFFAAYK
jgi:peptidoglycan hydrolase-like protein with peptidoglycan-binding domain